DRGPQRLGQLVQILQTEVDLAGFDSLVVAALEPVGHGEFSKTDPVALGTYLEASWRILSTRRLPFVGFAIASDSALAGNDEHGSTAAASKHLGGNSA